MRERLYKLGAVPDLGDGTRPPSATFSRRAKVALLLALIIVILSWWAAVFMIAQFVMDFWS